MGVPKFYRWISERYPCLSEVVKEYQIPEFDNLYLDMNGIIHICSHPNDNDPHFRITEEKMFKDIFHYIEVRFGGKKDSNSRTPTPEETTFHLLHLSLMREYINYEFHDLRCALPFPYDLESIIDDWVLMGFLVGNDFIPHLPHLHINKEALPILYRTYKATLPTLDGYLNEGGKLHLPRFEKFLVKLAEFELENFHEIYADLKYFKGKRLKDGEAFKANKRAMDLKPFNFEEEDTGDTLNGALLGSLEEDDDDEDEVEDLRRTYERLGYEPDPAFVDDEDEDEDSSTSEDGGGGVGGTFKEEFRLHKRDYYMTKMNIKHVNSAALHHQATNYVRAIQWILNYYYNGICSWSWYYPFHYAPYISDVRDFAHMEMGFELGRPFLPYQQLLAVLPPLSKNLLCKAYWSLLTSPDSPDWEAVVLIPFIDEERLLQAMEAAPKYFPVIHMNHAQVERVWRETWELPPDKIKKGLCPEVQLDIYFAGFPTLKHVDHKFHMAKEGVKVFQQNSRGENFILDITEKDTPDLRDVANQLLGKEVFVSWPHLIEAKVEAVSDARDRYQLGGNQEVQRHPVEHNMKEEFSLSRNSLISHHHDRWGINLNNTPILSGKMTLEKVWSKVVQPYPLQTIVKDIGVHSHGYQMHLTPQEYFPPRTKVFMLGQPHYGAMGEACDPISPIQVIEIDPSHKGRIRVAMTVMHEPNFDVVRGKQNQLEERYMTGEGCAKALQGRH
ncbi:5'-3' exoribonuclease 1 [Portunus trituberculatus]|uniref:5'-3' exoribonuclease 1 n=1 Tax=Portunus trituberculatus TaxID=210409 RepID=A0A5B7EBG8_PORTR|nr:5'-3' exoribonuclease 1 [Portunus trituberculatus]